MTASGVCREIRATEERGSVQHARQHACYARPCRCRRSDSDARRRDVYAHPHARMCVFDMLLCTRSGAGKQCVCRQCLRTGAHRHVHRTQTRMHAHARRHANTQAKNTDANASCD